MMVSKFGISWLPAGNFLQVLKPLVFGSVTCQPLVPACQNQGWGFWGKNDVIKWDPFFGGESHQKSSKYMGEF